MTESHNPSATDFNPDVFTHLIKIGNYRAAIELAQELLSRNPESYIVHGCLSRAYFSTGNYEKSLAHAEKMEELARTDEELAGAYNRLGLACWHLGKLDLALTYFERELRLGKKLRDRETQGTALNNMGAVYQDMAASQHDKEHLRKALRCCKTALNLKPDLKDQAVILHNIACIYADLDKSGEAMRYYRKSLTLSKKTGDLHGSARTMLQLGHLYVLTNMFSPARKLLEEGFRKIQEVGDRYWEYIGFMCLTDLHVAEKNYRKALSTCWEGYNLAKNHAYSTSHFKLRFAYILEADPSLKNHLAELIAEDQDGARDLQDLLDGKVTFSQMMGEYRISCSSLTA